MESTFKLWPRPRLRQDNCRKCLLPVRQQLIRKFKWSKKNWLVSQLHHHQLSRRKMMVTSRLLRKLRLKWLLPKLLWTRVLQRQIIEFNRCHKKMLACPTSEHWQICIVPYPTWVRWENKNNYKAWLKTWVLNCNQEKIKWKLQTWRKLWWRELKQLVSRRLRFKQH